MNKNDIQEFDDIDEEQVIRELEEAMPQGMTFKKFQDELVSSITINEMNQCCSIRLYSL